MDCKIYNYISADRTRCAWFDVHLRLWTMHEIDEKGNQSDDALYDNIKENAFKWLGDGWTKEEVKPIPYTVTSKTPIKLSLS